MRRSGYPCTGTYLRRGAFAGKRLRYGSEWFQAANFLYGQLKSLWREMRSGLNGNAREKWISGSIDFDKMEEAALV